MKYNVAKIQLDEALKLSEEILADIELSRLSLANIALKASRLSRILNDYDMQKIFQYEAGGYPSTATGVPKEAWRLAKKADRTYTKKEINNEVKEYANTRSIEEIEGAVESSKASLQMCVETNVNIASSNPSQYVSPPVSKNIQRQQWVGKISRDSAVLAKRKSYIYEYVLSINAELKFSDTAYDIFTATRNIVDSSLSTMLPNCAEKFNSINSNLRSENKEDWANAVHTCRKIFQDLADAIFPPSDDRKKGKLTIKLGKENYINRIIAFIEDNSTSKTFSSISGSHLEFVGNRIDTIYEMTNKGSHEEINDRQEAEKVFIYLYILLSDVIVLWDEVRQDG